MEVIGRKHWAIAEGYIPSQSSFAEPTLISHETACILNASDTAAHVRVTVSFNADGHEPWITAGVSSDLNQAALMAIVDGFHYWLLKSIAA